MFKLHFFTMVGEFVVPVPEWFNFDMNGEEIHNFKETFESGFWGNIHQEIPNDRLHICQHANEVVQGEMWCVSVVFVRTQDGITKDRCKLAGELLAETLTSSFPDGNKFFIQPISMTIYHNEIKMHCRAFVQ
jgi:hypothetical protein